MRDNAESHQEDDQIVEPSPAKESFKEPVVEPAEEEGEEDGEFHPSQEPMEEDDDPTLKDLSRITSEHFRVAD